MNQIQLTLDDRMNNALASIASDLASKSAFQPTEQVFHVKLCMVPSSTPLNMLHLALRTTGVEHWAKDLYGQLRRWVVEERELRLVIDVNPAFEAMEYHVCDHLRLARSRTTSNAQRRITVGSVEKIDPACHDAFIDAIALAYPIVDSSTFVATRALVCTSQGVLLDFPNVEMATVAAETTIAAEAPSKAPKAKPQRPRQVNKKNNATTASAMTKGAAVAKPMDLDGLIRSQMSINKKNKKGAKASTAQGPRSKKLIRQAKK